MAGSYRRLKETVGDLDLLVVCDDSGAATERFVSFPGVKRVLAKGPTKTSMVTGPDLQVDMRVVEEDCLGAALQYFTGSQSHSVASASLRRERASR